VRSGAGGFGLEDHFDARQVVGELGGEAARLVRVLAPGRIISPAPISL